MKRLHTRLPASVPKIRLDEYLCEWLIAAIGTHLSKTKIRNLILSGSVYVNRHRTKNPTLILYSGAVIEVYYDEEKASQNAITGRSQWSTTRLTPEDVVYEDDSLIIINKPSGLPTQPTLDPNRPNLFDLTKQFLVQREKTENVYVGLHHRLDKDTSGLVLFTKKETANLGISKIFSEHLIQKTYQCLVWKSPFAKPYQDEEVFKVENYLGKVSAKNEISKYGEVKSGGDYAETLFRVSESFRDVYWLEARPRTGRTHQIRVHTSELGLPILGDPLYFPADLVPFMMTPRLMLHAMRLQFIHPLDSQKVMDITTPLPDDFMQTLSALKR